MTEYPESLCPVCRRPGRLIPGDTLHYEPLESADTSAVCQLLRERVAKLEQALLAESERAEMLAAEVKTWQEASDAPST